MSQQIETHKVRDFARGISHLAQQQGSNLISGVIVDPEITGDRKGYDQLGTQEAEELVTRHGDTPLQDTPHSRRWTFLRRFVRADLVGEADVIRILNDPTNDYSRSFAWAMGRAIDDEIISRFFASAFVGRFGTTAQAFDTTNYQIAAGGAGMTPAKLRQAREILEAAENFEDGGDFMWMACLQARQRRDLLATTEVTSADYNTVKALVEGHVNQFMGFTFKKSQRLLLSGAERRCPFWVKASAKLSMAKEPQGRISERADKNHDTQVWYRSDFGGTRMDETGTVDVLCDET